MDALWDVAKKQCPSIKAAVVYSWPWIGDWLSPGSVEWSYNCNGDDETCADKLISYIKDGKPDISFVHFDSVDFAGHIHGFGGPQYYDNLKLVDGYIGMILDALDESGMFNDTLIMVLSDHGGFRHSHGYFNQENIFIPALFLGPGVRRSATLTRYISIMDFTPTGLNALGLRPTDEMRGKIVEEIYRSDHL
jgi:predicted AlkP superfamily pyrophosphatase or phosphodiesterase